MKGTMALLALTLSMILGPVMLGNPALASHLPEGDFGTMDGAGWHLQWHMYEEDHDGVDINFADYGYNFLFWGNIQYIGVKYSNRWNFDHLCHYADDTIPPSIPPNAAIPTCAAITDMTLTEGVSSLKISAEYDWADVYEYVQSWEFTDTGTAKFHLRYFGPGQCEGDNCSSYWPVWRMDFDVDNFDNKFFECIGGNWEPRLTEGTFVSTGTGDYCNGKEWRLRSGTTGAYKFINMWPVPRDEDSSKYLNPPRMHVTVSRSNEWDGGAGVNTYWPTQYVNGENINPADLVVWYEARMKWKEACERGGAEQCYTGFRAVAVNYN